VRPVYLRMFYQKHTTNRQSVVCGTGSTVITGCMSRTTTIHMRRTGRSFMTSTVVASGYSEVNKFGYLSSQSVEWFLTTSIPACDA
jgi:hypothetical protein